MFKKIPGNSEYLISLDKEIIDPFGKQINLKVDGDGNIAIELFEKVRKMSLQRLMLLSWYDMFYIWNFDDALDKIQFHPVKSKILNIRCGYLMSFTEPIYYNKDFRHIPSFPRYAINLNGDILDTLKNTIVTNKRISDCGYPMAYIFDSDKCQNKNKYIHRLVALAWIPNSDYTNRPFINHLDGNKENHSVDNLEWCSLAENAQHALRTGLNNQSFKMKSRDIHSGEIVVYDSVSDMARKLDMSNVSASNMINKLPGYLYDKKYEIKLFDDNEEWFYSNKENIVTDKFKSIYTIVVTDKKTGEIKRYNNVSAFFNAFSILPVTISLVRGIAIFKERFKDFDVDYAKNSISGPYSVIDTETFETKIFDTIWEAGEYIGITRTELQYDLSRGFKFLYSKKLAVIPNTKESVDLENYTVKAPPNIGVVITDTLTGKKTTVPSVRQTAMLTGIQTNTIYKNINTGKIVKGLEFRTLEW